MVGMERKKENSSADGRDIPASCPPAMVAIEREVPGNTAEAIWQAPIQTAWPRVISSIAPHAEVARRGTEGPRDRRDRPLDDALAQIEPLAGVLLAGRPLAPLEAAAGAQGD